MSVIAVDMMGSDSGPEELSLSVIHQLKDDKDVKFLLFGDEKKLNECFKDCKDKDRVTIENTTSIIPMEIKPLEFLRMRDSSMYKAIEAVRNKKVDAVISAGSSGGFITGSTILLRNIEGVTRAGLCTPFPTYKLNVPCVIMDVGANNVNTGEDIYNYGKMGRLFSQVILDVKDPSVYILSNGTEEGKGTDEIVEAYKLMKERNLPGFKGNVEARNAIDGTHDVVVTSGYAGNIYLKSTEGMGKIMNQLIKDSFRKNIFTMIGYLFAKKGFDQMKTIMDYRRFGGALLMGVNGICIKAHGNSNEYAFYQAISVAKKMIEKDIVTKLKAEFEKGEK